MSLPLERSLPPVVCVCAHGSEVSIETFIDGSSREALKHKPAVVYVLWGITSGEVRRVSLRADGCEMSREPCIQGTPATIEAALFTLTRSKNDGAP